MRKIAVADLETDPFEFGKVPEAFLSGYHDGKKTVSFWGADCVAQMVRALEVEREEYVIFIHNGGRFDIFYFMKHLTPGSIKIINGRIIQAQLGRHEVRDSFAIMPFGLSKYNKVKIDYGKFTVENRDKNRDEITEYWRMDCVYLWELCDAFIREFGDKLTIGGAALKQLKNFHSFDCSNENFDARFRTDFYHGGRNQVFESGILKGRFEVHDVNSMYPRAMQAFLHPVGTDCEIDKRLRAHTCFVSTTGINNGAFPVRTKSGGLDFTQTRGTFHTTIHEFEAAIETGSFRPIKIVRTYNFKKRITFADYVEHFYELRRAAIISEDEMHKLFYKFVLNSSYGKFAQNPENYFDWEITKSGERPDNWHDCVQTCEATCRKLWTPAFIHDIYVIWQRPTMAQHFYNVATGASITGAARAMLLRGLRAAKRPLYCDTDSIICESLDGVEKSEDALGAWKLEAVADTAAICGKKLYALFADGVCIKKAHKGARLTGEQIMKIGQGDVITCENPVPSFSWDGSHQFVTRRIRRTA